MDIDNIIVINPPLEEKLEGLPQEERELVCDYMQILNESEVKDIKSKCATAFDTFKATNDVKRYTCFTLALNWLIWEIYKTDKERAEILQDIWEDFNEKAYKIFTGSHLRYYFEMVD